MSIVKILLDIVTIPVMMVAPLKGAIITLWCVIKVITFTSRDTYRNVPFGTRVEFEYHNFGKLHREGIRICVLLMDANPTVFHTSRFLLLLSRFADRKFLLLSDWLAVRKVIFRSMEARKLLEAKEYLEVLLITEHNFNMLHR